MKLAIRQGVHMFGKEWTSFTRTTTGQRDCKNEGTDATWFLKPRPPGSASLPPQMERSRCYHPADCSPPTCFFLTSNGSSPPRANSSHRMSCITPWLYLTTDAQMYLDLGPFAAWSLFFSAWHEQTVGISKCHRFAPLMPAIKHNLKQFTIFCQHNKEDCSVKWFLCCLK